MTKHLAESLMEILRTTSIDIVRITLDNNSYIEVQPNYCNESLTDNILRVTTIEGIITYIDILQIYIIEIRKFRGYNND